MAPRSEPVGVILAGGLGRRIGGAKAIVELCGRPLIAYPMYALRAVLTDVAIVGKPDTELPSLPGAAVWSEPVLPRHPLVGILHALGMAAGRPVLVCAGDLPFVTPALIERIARASRAPAADRAPAASRIPDEDLTPGTTGSAGADPGPSLAVLAARGGAAQPLLGCYEPGAAEPLASALAKAAQGTRLPTMREAVAALGPRLLEVGDEDGDALFNVNCAQDLLRAEAMLGANSAEREVVGADARRQLHG